MRLATEDSLDATPARNRVENATVSRASPTNIKGEEDYEDECQGPVNCGWDAVFSPTADIKASVVREPAASNEGIRDDKLTTSIKIESHCDWPLDALTKTMSNFQRGRGLRNLPERRKHVMPLNRFPFVLPKESPQHSDTIFASEDGSQLGIYGEALFAEAAPDNVIPHPQTDTPEKKQKQKQKNKDTLPWSMGHIERILDDRVTCLPDALLASEGEVIQTRESGRGSIVDAVKSVSVAGSGPWVPPSSRVPLEFRVREAHGPVMPAGRKEELRFDEQKRLWESLAFPLAIPAGREQVVHLAHTLDALLKRLPRCERENLRRAYLTTSPAATATFDIEAAFTHELGIWDLGLAELVRQVGVQCAERGVLLERTRERYVDLFTAMMTLLRRNQGHLKRYIEYVGQLRQNMLERWDVNTQTDDDEESHERREQGQRLAQLTVLHRDEVFAKWQIETDYKRLQERYQALQEDTRALVRKYRRCRKRETLLRRKWARARAREGTQKASRLDVKGIRLHDLFPKCSIESSDEDETEEFLEALSSRIHGDTQGGVDIAPVAWKCGHDDDLEETEGTRPKEGRGEEQKTCGYPSSSDSDEDESEDEAEAEHTPRMLLTVVREESSVQTQTVEVLEEQRSRNSVGTQVALFVSKNCGKQLHPEEVAVGWLLASLAKGIAVPRHQSIECGIQTGNDLVSDDRGTHPEVLVTLERFLADCVMETVEDIGLDIFRALDSKALILGKEEPNARKRTSDGDRVCMSILRQLRKVEDVTDTLAQGRSSLRQCETLEDPDEDAALRSLYGEDLERFLREKISLINTNLRSYYEKNKLEETNTTRRAKQISFEDALVRSRSDISLRLRQQDERFKIWDQLIPKRADRSLQETDRALSSDYMGSTDTQAPHMISQRESSLDHTMRVCGLLGGRTRKKIDPWKAGSALQAMNSPKDRTGPDDEQGAANVADTSKTRSIIASTRKLREAFDFNSKNTAEVLSALWTVPEGFEDEDNPGSEPDDDVFSIRDVQSLLRRGGEEHQSTVHSKIVGFKVAGADSGTESTVAIATDAQNRSRTKHGRPRHKEKPSRSRASGPRDGDAVSGSWGGVGIGELLRMAQAKRIGTSTGATGELSNSSSALFCITSVGKGELVRMPIRSDNIEFKYLTRLADLRGETLSLGRDEIPSLTCLSKLLSHKPEEGSVTKNLGWLSRNIKDIYAMRRKMIKNNTRTDQSMIDAMFETLTNMYGAKGIVDKNVGMIVAATHRFRSMDLGVEMFARFLENRWTAPILSIFLQSSTLIEEHLKCEKGVVIRGTEPMITHRMCQNILPRILGEWNDAAFRDLFSALRNFGRREDPDSFAVSRNELVFVITEFLSRSMRAFDKLAIKVFCYYTEKDNSPEFDFAHLPNTENPTHPMTWIQFKTMFTSSKLWGTWVPELSVIGTVWNALSMTTDTAAGQDEQPLVAFHNFQRLTHGTEIFWTRFRELYSRTVITVN